MAIMMLRILKNDHPSNVLHDRILRSSLTVERGGRALHQGLVPLLDSKKCLRRE